MKKEERPRIASPKRDALGAAAVGSAVKNLNRVEQELLDDPPVTGEHTHRHRHEALDHEHEHAPDVHHGHSHS